MLLCATAAAAEDRPYVRKEPPEVRAFYKVQAAFYEKTPESISRFVAALERETRLPRNAVEYPVDNSTLARAAAAFSAAARAVYDVTLALERDDATQLDVLFNGHLIDARLRPYFEGASLRNLSESESEKYAALTEKIRVPNEPLFYYCAGAWWGEWLVRHRQGQWTLYAPLRPMQTFPDMITAGGTTCIHPFSQVTTKLSDPEGDALAFAASAATFKRFFPPYPLIASVVDADHAAASLMPPELRSTDATFADYERFLGTHSNPAPRVYALAIGSAWKSKQWSRVEEWSKRAIAASPQNPTFKHNLAVLYSQSGRLPQAVDLLEQAVRLDPNYGRAHLTLASCLLELNRPAEARRHAEWVRDHDGGLRDEAMKLLESAREH